MASPDYLEQLNDWHIELAIAVTAAERCLSMSDDDELGALGHVVKNRLRALVESCPFPVCSDPQTRTH